MKQTTGTLWIDLTMLVNWSAQLTGIQRVEYNLAKRFAEREHVRFCVFHKAERKLTEFDFAHITYKIDQLQHKDSAAAAQTEADAAGVVPLYRRVVAKAKRIMAPLLSHSSKTYLRRHYHRVGDGAQPSDSEPITFQSDDAFLILSGDWSDTTLGTMVAEMRAQTKCKVLQIVYDMLPAFYPGYFLPGTSAYFSTYMRQMFANCDGVLAISESTKRDVERFIGQHDIKPVPVQVFRLGDDAVKQQPVKPDADIQKDGYALCVSTVEARKNHLLLFYAVREGLSRGEQLLPIVVVGKRGWLADDFFYLVENDPLLRKKFIFLHCSDQELAWLYQNCSFTVFPSFYEGWGLPVAESLFYGKYCLASNSSSIPEIAGDLIEYFSPNDPMTLLEQMLHYTQNPALLKEKEKKIQATYKPTGWDDAFTQANEFTYRFLK